MSAPSRPVAATVLYALSGVAALLFLALGARIVWIANSGQADVGTEMALLVLVPIVFAGVFWLPLALLAGGAAAHAHRSARARIFSVTLSSSAAALSVFGIPAAGWYFYGGSFPIVTSVVLALPFFVTGALSFAARPSA